MKNEEFYLSDLVQNIVLYYREKLALVKTEFIIGEYKNGLLSGDMDRSIEVLQNIMENDVLVAETYDESITVTVVFRRVLRSARSLCIQRKLSLTDRELVNQMRLCLLMDCSKKQFRIIQRRTALLYVDARLRPFVIFIHT